MGMAASMLSMKGMKYAKGYLEPLPEGCGSVCEHGHPSCAHSKGGVCPIELKELIKNFNGATIAKIKPPSHYLCDKEIH